MAKNSVDYIPNILLVDDERINIDVVLSLFEKISKNNPFNTVVALSGRMALEIVKNRSIDMILLDIEMPIMNGYDVIEKLKADEATKDIPIIFLTANRDEASMAKAFNLGATDYVTKPFKPVELLARVKLILQHKIQLKELEYLAYNDETTGLYNRRKFFELAQESFTNEPDSLYAAFFSVDNFKRISDKHGREACELVIKKVADILKRELDEKGILARLRAGEFVYMYKTIFEDTLYKKIEALGSRLASLELQKEDGTVFKSSVSSVVTRYSPKFSSLEAMLQEAEFSSSSHHEQSAFR